MVWNNPSGSLVRWLAVRVLVRALAAYDRVECWCGAGNYEGHEYGPACKAWEEKGEE